MVRDYHNNSNGTLVINRKLKSMFDVIKSVTMNIKMAGVL